MVLRHLGEVRQPGQLPTRFLQARARRLVSASSRSSVYSRARPWRTAGSEVRPPRGPARRGAESPGREATDGASAPGATTNAPAGRSRSPAIGPGLAVVVAPSPRTGALEGERRVGHGPALPSPPTRSAAGAASVMNTSLKNLRPVISRSGRTSMPGWSMRIRKYEIPACLGTSTFVRATSIALLATWPPDVHTSGR